MLLKRLFSPKWRKSDSATTNPESGALTSADPRVRRQACKGLHDLAVLRRIADQDDDAAVRDLATARLRHLLNGDEPDGPDTQAAIEHLQSSPPPSPELCAHLAREAKDPDLRRAALNLLDAPSTLAAAAVHDPVAALRLTAARRLEDKAALEQVARQIGRKDKNVLREVRGKLKAIAEQEQEPLRRRQLAEELCTRVERLGRLGNWSQDKALLEHSEQEWREIHDDLPEALRQRYTSAREAFLQVFEQHREQVEAERQQQREQQALADKKTALIQELAAQPAEAVEQAALEALQQRWSALDTLPERQEKDLRRQWDDAYRKVNAAIAEQQQLREREQTLQALTQQGTSWLKKTTPLQNKAIKRWREQGQKLCAEHPVDAAAKAFGETRDELKQRLEKQQQHAQQKQEQLTERLDLLEQELEQGSLKPATALHQSLHADIDLCRASGLPDKSLAKADERLRRLTPRLREMQNWRKWGTDQHREELLQAMQALESAELEDEALFERVQELQQQWKSLDHSGSPVNEGLWKRFHQSADTAFERCKPFLARQAEQREANRQAREALCQRLEDFLDQVDWENVDWKKASRAEREIRNEWAEQGEVQPKQRRGLERRYRKAMDRLDQHLAKERAANKALKQQLIEQAKALTEEPDLDRAINEIKALQKQWHTTVPSRRKQENQLWRHFREACDQIFNRREETRDAQRKTLHSNADALDKLCEELEAVGAAAATEADELRHQLHKLQGRWHDESRIELARKDQERLKRRWQAGVRELEQRIALLRDTAERRRMERVATGAALCCDLESRVAGQAALETPQWEQRWSELELPDDLSAKLRRRFDAALQAAADPAARQHWLDGQAANAEQRAHICLQLEVMGGIDSPSEAAQERLAFQVDRLAEHLGEGEADPLTALPRLERDWYLVGPAPAAQADALEKRFQRALGAALPKTGAAPEESPPPADEQAASRS